MTRGEVGTEIRPCELHGDHFEGAELIEGFTAPAGDGRAGWNDMRTDIRTSIRADCPSPVAVACPDPHVERWYMADPQSFADVVGAGPQVERARCDRDRYKRLLLDAVRRGGNTPTLGGIEFAAELVAAMDLHRAGRREHSLRAFLDECRDSIRRVQEA